MPSFDTSLTARLINAGIPSGLAIDVAAAIVAQAQTPGAINPTSVGQSSAGPVKSSNYQSNFQDISGAPGNGNVGANNSGRAAIAAAATTCVVTASTCNAASRVNVQLEGAFDATCTNISVTPAAGSFTVTGNAAATGVVKFNFDIKN